MLPQPKTTPLLLGLALALTASAPSAVAQSTHSKLWGKNGELWSPAGRLPDFSHAGYRNGEQPIPDYPVTANVADFGAKGDDDADDTAAFLAAVEKTESGAILIPPGRYIITNLVKITRPGVVLRGSGTDKTTLYFPKPLEEIAPNPSATTTGRPTSNYSWSGGFIQITGQFNPQALTPITVKALRGDHAITVAKPETLSVGQSVEIRVTDSADQSLIRHLYSDDAGDISKVTTPARTSIVVRITRIDGDRIEFERPLRFDIRPEWTPTVHEFAPSVTDSGVEDITFEFPNTPYEGHFTELGYNPLVITNSAHCWGRRLRIVNADSGPMIGGAFHTVSDVIFESQREPDNRGHQGHHGILFGRIGDHLFTRFDFRMRFIHDIGLGNQCAGLVVTQGKGVDLSFDNHKRAPYDTLITAVDIGKGSRPWMSGGGAALGKHSGARITLWNLASTQQVKHPPEGFAPWSMNLVGVKLAEPDATDETKVWREDSNKTVHPHDLHAAQLARRLGAAKTSSAQRKP